MPEGQFWTTHPAIQILNKNEHPRTSDTQRISIDRKTTMGNPFYFSNAVQGERDKSVAAFNDLICRIEVSNEYAGDKMLEDIRCAHGLSIAPGTFDQETFKADITTLLEICHSGKPIALVCHCAPQNCHGYAIRNLLIRLTNKQSNNN